MRRLAAAVLATVLLALLGAGPVHAADATAAPKPTLRVVDQTSWLTANGQFQIELAETNVTDPALVDMSVSVYPKLTSRSAFQQTLDGKVSGRALKQVVVPLTSVGLSARGNLSLAFPLPQPNTPSTISTLPSLAAGVYPMAFELRVHGGASLTKVVTHLVRLPDTTSGSALDVAWLQPLADANRAGAGALIGALAGNPTVPITLDLTPAVIATMAPTDLQALKSLLDARHPLLAAPYVDVDPTALVNAGLSDDLALQRETGEDVLFGALGNRGDPRTWSIEQPLSAGALSRLRSLGVTRVALTESSLKPTRLNVTLAYPYALDAGDGDVIQAVSADDGLAAHFHSGGDQVLAAHQLLADLAVLYFDAPGATRGVVVRPPASWRPNATFLGAVLPALTGGTSILHPVTLDGLFADVPEYQSSSGTAIVRTLSTSARYGTLPAARLASAHDTLDEFVAIVGPTTSEAETARRRLLSAESDRLSGTSRSEALASLDHALDTMRGNLHMPQGRTFRLTARSGTIPLTVVNDNPFPVRVNIVLSSEKLEFTDVHGSDRSRQVLSDIILQPGTLTRTVPVKARASAAFSLQVTLHAPTGQELDRSRFTIISTAFSGVGIVLSIGAALFLLLWWVRHWRTVRRDRRLVDIPAH